MRLFSSIDMYRLLLMRILYSIDDIRVDPFFQFVAKVNRSGVESGECITFTAPFSRSGFLCVLSPTVFTSGVRFSSYIPSAKKRVRYREID